jgi:ABC-2 type transport system ATP-binding protein
MESAIFTQDLRKTIGWLKPQIIVDRLNLLVTPGRIFGLLGPNGAGKTTTFKLLLGLSRITSGKAFLFGHPVPSPLSRQNTGYLPEVVNHPDYLSVREYLGFHTRLAGVNGDLAEISAQLARVGLPGSQDLKLGELSKGMRQRVDLARVLLLRSRLILLDEPVSGLDPMGQAVLKSILIELKKEGISILINSHAIGMLADLCDEIAIMNKGTVMCSGVLVDLLKTDLFRIKLSGCPEDPLSILASREVGDSARFLGEGAWELDFKQSRPPEEVMTAVLHKGWKISSAGPVERSLEEMFTKIIQAEKNGEVKAT